MLHLTESVALGKQARAACLPNPVDSFSGDALVGEMLTVSGWGSMNPGRNNFTHPAVLHSANVPVISQDDCRKSNGDITDSMICTSRDGGVGFCKGDSGGEFVYFGKVYEVLLLPSDNN